MAETEAQKAWRRDARVAGEIGAVLADQSLPRIEVRLPRHLAEQAIAAWERDDGEGPLDPETGEQWRQRKHAAALALIGLSITESGHWEEDAVLVDLDPVFIGDAADAADDLPTSRKPHS